jgi:hypothetical protein
VGLALLGQRLRIDRIGDQCALWPRLEEGVLYGLGYLVSLALLTVGWLRMSRLELPMRRVLGWGVLVHLTAMIGAPFLSLDTLCYSSLGRAMCDFHGSPYQPLTHSLPGGDTFLVLLPVGWRTGGSAYWPGFHQLARAIAAAGGPHLWIHLRLYQLVGVLSAVSAAALVGLAVDERDEARFSGAEACALVLFCPLTVIEATVNAHNDALMMMAVALFALLSVRRTPGLVALAIGATIKASGLILFCLHAAQLAFARARRLLSPERVLGLGLVGTGLAIGGFFLLRRSFPVLDLVSSLLGSPADPFEHCTRSVECLPRAFLKYVAHRDMAAFGLGLAFRAASCLWLLYVAMRSAQDGRVLEWSATGLFVYYLFFHGYMQSWYLLSLVPLLPFANARLRPVMLLFCVTSLVYYGVHLPLNCAVTPTAVAVREVTEAVTVIVPPAALLLAMWVKGRVRDAV